MRLTLGASRWRVVRQMMTEILLLAIARGRRRRHRMLGKGFHAVAPGPETRSSMRGSICGCSHSRRACRRSPRAASASDPRCEPTRANLAPSLKAGGRKGRLARGVATRVLLTAQVAISLVLLVGAGLLVRTLYNLSRVDVGFNADNLLVFGIDPALQNDSSPRVFDLYDRIMAAIEAVPGVQSCTMSVMPLVARSEWEEPVQPDGAGLPKNAFIQIARWNFLETMGIPLVAGRDLSAADTQGRPRVAVINETMARQVFGERMPVGRHFQFVNGGDRNVPIQVIGVARDSRYASLEQQVPPTLFMPHAQVPPSGMTVEVRTASDPMTVASAIREAVRQI